MQHMVYPEMKGPMNKAEIKLQVRKNDGQGKSREWKSMHGGAGGS